MKQPPKSPPNPGPWVLIVDDQQTNLNRLEAILGSHGFQVIPALSGEIALERMAITQPDMVILDLMMEGMDGLEVCRRIREKEAWADIPVIFLSATDDKEVVVRALESGGVDYVIKPFDAEELVSRVRAQLALKAARDRLRQLAEDKDELLGILAHDFKNCLGGMHMTAQLMSDRVATLDDPRLGRMVESLKQSSGLMLAFVREFLANSRADNVPAFQAHPLCLKTAVINAIGQYQEAARRKHLSLRLDLTEGDGTVHAASAALGQVIDNLVSNAIKFSPADREIVVGVQPAGEALECYVKDQGPGFSEADKKQMFRRYTRLSARPTGGEPSTGLGLSIVKKLVDAIGGTVVCESSRGSGTTFRVRLPRPTTVTAHARTPMRAHPTHA